MGVIVVLFTYLKFHHGRYGQSIRQYFVSIVINPGLARLFSPVEAAVKLVRTVLLSAQQGFINGSKLRIERVRGILQRARNFWREATMSWQVEVLDTR